MKRTLKFNLLVLATLMSACGHHHPPIHDQEAKPVFPKGNKIDSNNFTGTVWVEMFLRNDSTYNSSIGNVTFEPKARTHWHKHPGGQILLVTAGKGYYQLKGQPARLIRQGDVVKIPPETEHWHGAAPDSSLTHIAISTNVQMGAVVWLQPVTDDEYRIPSIR